MFSEGRLYLGHLGPIPLFLHWSALVMVALAWMWSHPLGDIPHLATFLILLTWLAGGIICHELGHGLMARRFGATGITITVWALGGVCASQRSLRPWREIAILAAGPGVSLLLAALCRGTQVGLAAWDPPWLAEHTGTWVALWLEYGYLINLSLFIFNCIPLYPLDGGQIVFNAALLATRRLPLAALITFIGSAISGLVFLAWQWRGGRLDWWDVILVGFLLQTAWGLVAATRR